MKGAVLYALQDHPLLQPRGDLDESTYVALARYPTQQPFFVSPLYIYFLRALDVNLFVVRLVQIVLGAMAVLLIFDCARLWFGDRAATIAAILAILTGVIAFYEVTFLQAALDPFLVAVTLGLLAHALIEKDPALFFATGLTAGLFVLNRPNAIVWIPLLAIAIVRTRGWRVAALFAVACALPIVPVTIRNYVASGQVVIIASHGGLNFYIGNNPEADGTYHHVPGIRPTIAGQQEDAARDEASHGSFYRRAWMWIESHPAAALTLFVRKLAYTFNQTDLALNYSYAYFAKDVASPLKVLVVAPWLLFPLGLVGTARSLRNRQFAVWALFIPIYAVSVAIFFVSSRYRLPLLIPMCIASGAMFVRPRIWHWVAAAALGVFVCWNFGLDDGRAHERTNMVVYLLELHRLDDAALLVADTETITRDPATLHARAAAAFKQAGVELVQSNQPNQALKAFQSAHRFDPADASNLLNIAVLEAQHGDTIAARENARAALRLRPGYPQALALLRALEGR
ncbi:MAG: glycosyltransferase family 39 protein [Acidobacteriota bacterium]|nr:glycosyltransferase family 39 protein [Acidobacteriota bacterium]